MPQKKVSATIHVTAVFDGQNGQSPVVLSLRCSAAVVSFKDSQGIVIGTPATYNLSLVRTVGETMTVLNAVPTGYSLKFKEGADGEWNDGQSLGTLDSGSELLDGQISELSYGLFKGSTLLQSVKVVSEWPVKGDKGQNGIDAQDTEWAYIRTKGNTPPRIADSSGTDSNGNQLTDDDYMPSAYIESIVAGGIEANDINSSDHPNTYGSNNYICGECTDDPKGVDDEWPYEWEIKREKGTADANGHRAWTAYSGTMTLHNNLAAHSVNPNILLRTFFDRGIDFVLEAWRRNSDNYAVIDTASDTVVNGRKSIRLDAMNSGNDVNFYQSLLGKLKANTWYTLSFNAFIANGGGNLIVSLYNLFGGTRTNIFGNGLKVILDGEDYQVSNDGNNDVLITGGWDGKRHTITFLTNGSISTETLNLQFYQAYGSGTGNHSIACICMPKLEEGRMATAYMPHESDLEGADAVVYSLQCFPAAVNFRSNAVGEFSGSYTVVCKVMKTVGNNTTEVAASSGIYDGMYLKCRKLNTSGNYTSWNAASSATLTPSDALTKHYVVVEFALSANSDMTAVKARVSVPIMCDGHRGAPGEPGATGKMFYPMGEWNAQITYSRTGDLVPLVFLPDPGNYNETIGAEGHYFYLYDDTNTGTRPVINDSTNPWRLCDTFGVVITQGLFAEFAKMGKGIFSGDYFFSMNGCIVTSATASEEKIAGATYTYNGVTKPAYTWFKGDPSEQTTYPYFEPNWWVDLLTGKMSAARGNFVVDAVGSVVATNGTFEGLLRARSMETMFADLTDKYRKVDNTYVALNGDSGSQGEYILGEDVYERVGNSYVKVDITGIYNFVVGNTAFILPADNAFISKRVLLFNGNVNTAGGTSKGVNVETWEIYDGLTTARFLKGVGKEVKYDPDTRVPSNHVLPSGSAVPVWSFDPVSKLFFVNGVVELIAVPATDDTTLCDWSVVNIGTNCYMLY